MNETAKRLIAIFLKNSIKILSLLLAVSIIAFALISASPVDPASQYIMSLGTAVSAEQRAELEAYWGVNEPPVERYFNWLTSLLKGDMGHSAIFRRPVADVISERFMNSLALMICAWLLAGIIGFLGNVQKHLIVAVDSAFHLCLQTGSALLVLADAQIAGKCRGGGTHGIGIRIIHLQLHTLGC